MRPSQTEADVFSTLHKYIMDRGGEIFTVRSGKGPDMSTHRPRRRLTEYLSSTLRAIAEPPTITYECKKRIYRKDADAEIFTGRSTLTLSGNNLTHTVVGGPDAEPRRTNYKNTGRGEVLIALGYIGSLFPKEALKDITLPPVPRGGAANRPYQQWELPK